MWGSLFGIRKDRLICTSMDALTIVCSGNTDVNIWASMAAREIVCSGNTDVLIRASTDSRTRTLFFTPVNKPASTA